MFDVTKRNYLKSTDTTNKIMKRVIISLIPIMLFAWIKNGVYPFFSGKYDASFYDLIKPLLVMIVPIITTVLTEFIHFKYILKEENIKIALKESYAILPGLLLGLIVPINTPLYILILGSIFAIVIGKIAFGGFSYNIFNPALLGRLFIIFAYSSIIASNLGYISVVDTTSSATPLSMMANNSYIVNEEFSYSLVDLFFGFYPGCLGEVSVFLCICAFIYLTTTKTIKHRIPIAYISTVFIITLVVGLLNSQSLAYPLYHIMSGGLFFGAIFMATDPVTSPISNYAQIIYGICLGILTCIFRFLTVYPEGVLTSILTMNLIVGLINYFSIKTKNNKKIVWIGLTLLSIIAIVLINFTMYVEEVEEVNYIEEKEVTSDGVRYVITKRGFSSDITIELTIKSDKITKIEVLSQNDSYYATIEELNYVNEFKTNVNNISDIDTVSSVTKTSTTIKDIVLIAVYDYLEEEYEIEEEEEFDFAVLEENIIDDDTVVYKVSKQGFVGEIIANVTFVKDEFYELEILSNKESYYHLIEENDYIEEINANYYDGIDVVSGATYTSTAIKDLIDLTIEYIGGSNE